MHRGRSKAALNGRAPTRLIRVALYRRALNQHSKTVLGLRTPVTIEALIQPPTGTPQLPPPSPFGHLAVSFVRVTGRLSAEAARGMMDDAAASCSYMMEGDFQLR